MKAKYGFEDVRLNQAHSLVKKINEFTNGKKILWKFTKIYSIKKISQNFTKKSILFYFSVFCVQFSYKRIIKNYKKNNKIIKKNYKNIKKI